MADKSVAKHKIGLSIRRGEKKMCAELGRTILCARRI
jgi:hypothetical protein